MLLDFRDTQYRLYERRIEHTSERDVNGIIMAADTESFLNGDVWEPELLTYCDSAGSDFRWLPSGCCPFELYLDLVTTKLGDSFSHSKSSRDWPVIYGYFHNLEYDWGQLIKGNSELYQMSKFLRVFKRYNISIGGHNITFVRGMFKGNVCYVSCEVSNHAGSFKLELRDTFAFFSKALSKVAEDFGFPPKEERPEDIGRINHRDMPDCEEKAKFVEYALRDAEVTYNAAQKIVDMHRREGIGVLKVSASSYACSVMTRRIDPDKPMINDIGNKGLLQFALNSYYGGRFGGLVVGRVENINIFDINSSYPTALSCLPSFTKDTCVFAKQNPNLEQTLRFINMFPCSFVEVSATEVSDKYPSIVTRLPNGDLCPVFGRFEHIYTTGPELYVGVKLGGLKDITVHNLVAWYDNNPFFHDLMHDLYEIKRTATPGSVEYTIAKLVMNSIYGKFIESHNPLKLLWLDDMVVLIKPTEPIKWGMKYYDLYMSAIHKGEEPFSYISRWMADNKDMQINRKSYKEVKMSDLQLAVQDFGYYAIPPLAAAVTGIARARLLVAMKVSEAIYWDTDSVFTTMSREELADRLEVVPKEVFPGRIPRLAIGQELGDLTHEREGISGYLAGIKRYWFDQKKHAHHSMPLIGKEEIENGIRSLVDCGSFRYPGRSRPLNLLEAPSLDDLGRFVPPSADGFEIKLSLDYRMEWKEKNGQLHGSMKPYTTILKEVGNNDF